MRQQPEPRPLRADEPGRDPALERDRPRSSRSVRPIAVSAIALIVAAVIVVILAAAF
jgi:hypothetical protein